MSATDHIDLTTLVERLRLARFRVDTRQYLTAHELLLALAATNEPLGKDSARLISHLGPIFCTTPEEQRQFADEIRRWLGEVEPPPPPPPPVADRKNRQPFAGWRRARWWRRPVLLAVPIVLVIGVVVAWYYVPITVRGTIRVQSAGGRLMTLQQAGQRAELLVNGAPLSVSPDGAFAFSLARAQSATLQANVLGYGLIRRVIAGAQASGVSIDLVLAAQPTAPAESATPRERVIPSLVGLLFSGESSDQQVRWRSVAAFALVTAAVALGLLWLVARMRGQLALRNLPVYGDPETVTLPVPETSVLPVPENDLNRAAVALRRLREGSIVDLDVRSTVEETARSAGFFRARFAPRRAMPEYVVLISRRGAEDHQARTFDALFEHLSGRNVVLDRYSFHDDPRLCWWEQSGRSFRLADVLDRHHRATLIVCAETICAFNRVTGALADWVEATSASPNRVFLTTEAPDRWTSRELELEGAGFVVLPASEDGWRVLRDFDGTWRSDELFPAPYTRMYPALIGPEEIRWLDRNEPPRPRIDKLLKQLEGFLGPQGFAWLCACAVYPEITWALTLRVMGDPRRIPILPSLARLPWFRHGFMPDWLRRALVARIPRDEERRLRDDLERLLEDLTRGQTRSGWGSMLHIGRWLGPIDLIRAAAPGSPLRDQVFLGFMAGANQDPLWLRAPRALMRLFERQPNPFELPRAETRSLVERALARVRVWTALNPVVARVAASVAIGVLSILPLQRVLAVERVSGAQEPLWFAEVSDTSFQMGADTTNVDGYHRPHQIVVPGFFIARTEVTVGQYRACVADGGCAPQASLDADPVDLPVRNVSWQDAMRYCAWLEGKLRAMSESDSRVISALAGRLDTRLWRVTLPSEAEWERSARPLAADGFVLPATNSGSIRFANYSGLKFGKPTAVGSFPLGLSDVGVLDMAGNLAEWTRTAAAAEFVYPYRSDDGREQLDTTVARRVVRGGSFRSDISELQPASRSEREATSRNDDLGFRVVVSTLGAVTPGTVSTSPTPVPVPPPVVQDSAPCVLQPPNDRRFPTIYFDKDLPTIPPAAARTLAGIAAVLRRTPGRLVIEGHVPATGSDEYNLALSERLAAAVKADLTGRGISADRLTVVSYGGTRLECLGVTDRANTANRRVEFTFFQGYETTQQPPPAAGK